MKITQAIRRPFDNFGIIRLLLSLAVIISHMPIVSGMGATWPEPLLASTGFSLGQHAVNCFFVISGFLIAMSWDRRANPIAFVLARLLRLWPALILAAVFCVSFAAFVTPLKFIDISKFLGNIIFQLKADQTLPHIFTYNNNSLVLGTVWTLRYEVECYIGVLFLGFSGLLPNRLVIVAIGAYFALNILAVDVLHIKASILKIVSYRLRFLFCVGVLFYIWRDYVRLNWLILGALIVFTLLLKSTPLYHFALFIAESYGIMYLAIAPHLSAKWLNIRTDLSYGVYLLGWPVQQFFASLYKFDNPYWMLIMVFPVTLGLAYISWIIVEKPALNLKYKLIAGCKPWRVTMLSVLKRS